MAGYNRIAAGERIRNRRMIMGLTQEELAEKIGRAYKYCQDIERGTCGMSIDTMLSIAACLNISLDYLIYGNNEDSTEFAEPCVFDKQSPGPLRCAHLSMGPLIPKLRG